MKVQAAPNFFKSLKNLNSLRSKYYSAIGWVKHIFKKDTFKVIKHAINGYEWDYSYLYELEQIKITQMANYIEKTKRFVGWEQVVRDMRICVNLIDIFLEKKSLFDYDGEIKYIPIEGSEDVEVDTSSLTYHCDVKVNTQNAARFVDTKSNKWYVEHPHELYILKAKALYHKIRLERDSAWWD